MIATNVTLPKVKPKWNRTFHSSDVSPSLSDNTSSRDLSCQICEKNSARYTCPKCFVEYCSVKCYKNHDSPSDSNGGTGTLCTEMFYREKVNQVSKLAIKDETNVAQVRDILTRAHYGDENSQSSDDSLDDEDILELEKCINILDESNVDENDEDVLSLLPLHLRQKFEKSVLKGEVSDLIHPWQPFWMPNYHSHFDSNESTNISDDDYVKDGKTLDERILQIVPFHILLKGKESSVPLEYNVCEVLFMTAFAFRSYRAISIKGISNKDDIFDCASFLVEHSQVLSQDARFTSIQEVLMENTTYSNRFLSSTRGVHTVKSDTLVKDLLYITKHRRMVLRVLFSAIDVIKAAIRYVKKHSELGDGRKLKLAMKKIEFMLSWSNSHWKAIDFSDDIASWLDIYSFESSSDDQITVSRDIDSLLTKMQSNDGGKNDTNVHKILDQSVVKNSKSIIGVANMKMSDIK